MQLIDLFKQLRQLHLPSNQVLPPLQHLLSQHTITTRLFQAFLHPHPELAASWTHFHSHILQPKLSSRRSLNSQNYTACLVNHLQSAKTLEPDGDFLDHFLVEFRQICFKEKTNHLMPVYDLFHQKLTLFAQRFQRELFEMQLMGTLQDYPLDLSFQSTIQELNNKATQQLQHCQSQPPILQQNQPPSILRLAKDLTDMVQMSLNKNLQHYHQLLEEMRQKLTWNKSIQASIAQTCAWWKVEGQGIMDEVASKQRELLQKLQILEENWRERVMECQKRLSDLSSLVLEGKQKEAVRKAMGY